MTLEEDTAEEGWKDDDFLLFGGGTAEEDQAKEAEDPAEASSDPSNHAATSVPAASDLPPWMDQHTDFRRVPPLVALHNEIVGFCKLMSPMPEVCMLFYYLLFGWVFLQARGYRQ